MVGLLPIQVFVCNSIGMVLIGKPLNCEILNPIFTFDTALFVETLYIKNLIYRQLLNK
jgi:hypothetical protein